MSPLFLRALSGSALLITAIGCAGDPLGTGQPVDDSASRQSSADPKTPFEVGMTLTVLKPGATEQLVVTKVANGHAVPETSVRFSSSEPRVATVSDAGLVTAVRVGEATISVTRGIHRIDVQVVVTACGAIPLPMGATNGRLEAGDCTLGARLVDYYVVENPGQAIMQFRVQGVTGVYGYMLGYGVPHGSETVLLGAVNTVQTLRAVATGGRYYVYVAGNVGATGDYTITRSAPDEPHHCTAWAFVQPGVSFPAAMTPENACPGTVQITDVPEAVGKPLAAHYYRLYLKPGKSYTVTLSGLTDDFDPSLLIQDPSRRVAAKALAGSLPAPASRTVTFTPEAEGYYVIELSSGRFIDDLVTWQVRYGSYQLTISQ